MIYTFTACMDVFIMYLHIHIQCIYVFMINAFIWESRLFFFSFMYDTLAQTNFYLYFNLVDLQLKKIFKKHLLFDTIVYGYSMS